ncbi:MAG: NfeD family protein [Candidatus Babeliales bacterium]
MNQFIFFWLVIALTFVLFEIAHPGLFLCLSFAVGACLAAIASYLDYNLVVQTSVALIGTLLGFLALYSWIRLTGYAGPGHGSHPSGVYALPGKRAVVTKAIVPDQFGQVKINGEIWSARSDHNQHIPHGTLVEVVYQRGAHVVVKELAASR